MVEWAKPSLKAAVSSAMSWAAAAAASSSSWSRVFLMAKLTPYSWFLLGLPPARRRYSVPPSGVYCLEDVQGCFANVQSVQPMVDHCSLASIVCFLKVIGQSSTHGSHIPSCNAKSWSLQFVLLYFCLVPGLRFACHVLSMKL